jgi:hypothetical protein
MMSYFCVCCCATVTTISFIVCQVHVSNYPSSKDLATDAKTGCNLSPKNIMSFLPLRPLALKVAKSLFL